MTFQGRVSLENVEGQYLRIGTLQEFLPDQVTGDRLDLLGKKSWVDFSTPVGRVLKDSSGNDRNSVWVDKCIYK